MPAASGAFKRAVKDDILTIVVFYYWCKDHRVFTWKLKSLEVGRSFFTLRFLAWTHANPQFLPEYRLSSSVLFYC